MPEIHGNDWRVRVEPHGQRRILVAASVTQRRRVVLKSLWIVPLHFLLVFLPMGFPSWMVSKQTQHQLAEEVKP